MYENMTRPQAMRTCRTPMPRSHIEMPDAASKPLARTSIIAGACSAMRDQLLQMGRGDDLCQHWRHVPHSSARTSRRECNIRANLHSPQWHNFPKAHKKRSSTSTYSITSSARASWAKRIFLAPVVAIGCEAVTLDDIWREEV